MRQVNDRRRLQRTSLAVAMAAVALCFTVGRLRAQPTTPEGQGGAMPTQAEIAQHTQMLIAQCPTPPALTESEADKLPIHVTHWGTEGPRVLIIHGGVQGGAGGGPATFAKQEVLSHEGLQLEVVDRPGFGQSPTRGVDDMERDSVWIANMLGNGANLIGHSWGGVEALLAAARRPEAVRSLILIEPALTGVLMSDPELRANPAVQAGGAQRIKLIMTAKTPADYGRGFIKMLGSAAEGNEVAARFNADEGLATRSGCALLQGRVASPAVTQKAIKTIAQAGVPVLIVTGGYSPAFEAAGDVLARLIGGRHITVTSPTHFVQFMNPDDFNREVVAFMRQADQARPTLSGKPTQ